MSAVCHREPRACGAARLALHRFLGNAQALVQRAKNFWDGPVATSNEVGFCTRGETQLLLREAGGWMDGLF